MHPGFGGGAPTTPRRPDPSVGVMSARRADGGISRASSASSAARRSASASASSSARRSASASRSSSSRSRRRANASSCKCVVGKWRGVSEKRGRGGRVSGSGWERAIGGRPTTHLPRLLGVARREVAELAAQVLILLGERRRRPLPLVALAAELGDAARLRGGEPPPAERRPANAASYSALIRRRRPPIAGSRSMTASKSDRKSASFRCDSSSSRAAPPPGAASAPYGRACSSSLRAWRPSASRTSSCNASARRLADDGPAVGGRCFAYICGGGR